MNEPLPQWVAWIIMPVSILLVAAIFVRLRRYFRIGTTRVPAWARHSTNCLNAYIRRDYAECVSAGQTALAVQFIPTVGLVTILALRRLGRSDDAEALGRALLLRGFGPNGMFLILMRVLDADLDAEQFLRESDGGGSSTKVTPDLECQTYFYWVPGCSRKESQPRR
jgi:hypothetical protein